MYQVFVSLKLYIRNVKTFVYKSIALPEGINMVCRVTVLSIFLLFMANYIYAADMCSCFKMGYSAGAFNSKKHAPPECRDHRIPGTSQPTYDRGKAYGNWIEGKAGAQARSKNKKWLEDRKREYERDKRRLCL